MKRQILRHPATLTAILGTTALLVAAGLLPRPALASHRNTTITTDDDRAIESCDQIKVLFGDRDDPMPTAKEEKRFTVARGDAAPLRIDLPDSGGMRVQGWDRDEYAVTVCKAAGGRSAEAAKKVLEEISLSRERGRIASSGPEEGTWYVFLIVKAPKNADLDLETGNGEIGLFEVSGRVRARSENGPISLKRCSSEVQATTQNGPISISGGSGDFKLRAENGPISVDLSGESWQGPGLVARTENGPLELGLPGNYRSGIRVEASGYSPMECKAKECRTARRSWDEDSRWVEFGGTPPAVRLSTVNGPVSIKSRVREF